MQTLQTRIKVAESWYLQVQHKSKHMFFLSSHFKNIKYRKIHEECYDWEKKTVWQ